MKPEDALTIMQITQPLATLDHARAFIALCDDRGLSPFVEVSPIFAMKREQRGDQWVDVAVKGMSIKESYHNVDRWAAQCGGYSVPVRFTTPESRDETNYGKTKTIAGIKAVVRVLTNRDRAAIMQIMQLSPGMDYKELRDEYLKEGEAWVSLAHRPPSGWTVEKVALKRATEAALLNAFGREPSQSRQMYNNVLTASAGSEARAALYGSGAQPALPAPAVDVLEGDYTPVIATVDSPPDPGATLTPGGARYDSLTFAQLNTLLNSRNSAINYDAVQAVRAAKAQAVVAGEFDGEKQYLTSVYKDGLLELVDQGGEIGLAAGVILELRAARGG